MNDTTKPVYRITDLALDERPRERLAHLGPHALAHAELLAILYMSECPARMPFRWVTAS